MNNSKTGGPGSWRVQAIAVIAATALWILLAQIGWVPLNPFDGLVPIAEGLREELPTYGAFAPLVYVFVYAAQIVIAPIPGHGLSFTAGFLFGAPLATLYSLCGILIGSTIAFIAARQLGWPLIEKMAPRSWIESWRNLATVNSSFTWFLVMLAPTADVFYYIAGLTRLTLKRMLVLVLLGRGPGIVLSTLIGGNVESLGAGWILVLIGALFVVAWFGHFVRARLQKKIEFIGEPDANP
jgi:uncharacterized membrane protein YdjX (TVP38/TMEM64 family)